MGVAYILLRCIGKAVVKNVVNLVTFGVGGDILVDAWDYWQEETREAERPAQAEAVAQLSAAELREEVERVVREEVAALSPEQKTQVAAYLAQVPAAIRRSLRRPSDPSGRTTAAGTQFRKPEDLAPLLPAGLPRFKPGDRPLPGADWELVELLGVGGFGEVWKARNPHFDGIAPVALKFCLDPAAKERLLKHEAHMVNQVMRQGRHEGIVPLLHTYLSADPPCLEYEYIDGGDLTGLMRNHRLGCLPAPEAARVLVRLAKIVGFAHRLNPPIVHRDLKPANILNGAAGLRITDFGIGGLAIRQAVAKSRRGSTSGEHLTAAVRGAYTPLYASPQQMRGDLVAHPSDDVYALGVIWYQLLTGDLTAGRPGGEAWKKRLTERGMTPALLALLGSCFEDLREDRPADAAELAERLDRAQGEEEVKLVEEPPPPSVKAAPKPAPAPKSERPLLLDCTGEKGASAADVRKSQEAWAKFLGWKVEEEDEIAPGMKMRFALVPPGKFLMGSTKAQIDEVMRQFPDAKRDYFDRESPRHEVELTRPFYLAANDVTRGQFRRFVEATKYQTEAESDGKGSYGWDAAKKQWVQDPKYTWRNAGFAQTDEHPVVSVSRNDALKFVEWAAEKVQGGLVYRLPTEAEWEYSSRGGRPSSNPFGIGDGISLTSHEANFDGNYPFGGAKKGPYLSKTSPVGSYKANALGLFDMQGNVWQWCADWFGDYPTGRVVDPEGPASGSSRVYRGGGWFSFARDCRAAYRSRSAPDDRVSSLGFRLARVPPSGLVK